MAYENKPNSGALFKNTNKEKETQPDYSGPFVGPNGEEMQIAAWLKKGRNGTFMSVQVSPKFQPRQQEPAQAVPTDYPLDDSLPF